MSPRVILAFVLVAVLAGVPQAHSFLTYPQPMNPGACRRGNGNSCAGPCHSDYMTRTKTWFSPVTGKPASVFGRGKTFTLKYARNNHTPGGFIRVAIVPVDKALDKRAHEKGAFHYSCWGAGTTVAKPEEITRDEYGFNMVGDDGKYHTYPPAYYSVRVTIPPVVPDGRYILGWVWFGGIGGGKRYIRNHEQEGLNKSYFADYWSCSYIEIKGGVELSRSFTPEFVNTKAQFSDKGCKTAWDDVGQCPVETCRGKRAFYGKPEVFQDGKVPPPLTPETFGGTSPPRSVGSAPATAPAPAPVPAPKPPPPRPPKPARATQAPPRTSREPSPQQWRPQGYATSMYIELFEAGHRSRARGRLSSGDKVCPAEYENSFTMVCQGVPRAAMSVTFYVNGAKVRTERFAPYVISGNRGYWMRPWTTHPRGTAELKCVATTGDSVSVRVRFSCR